LYEKELYDGLAASQCWWNSWFASYKFYNPRQVRQWTHCLWKELTVPSSLSMERNPFSAKNETL